MDFDQGLSKESLFAMEDTKSLLRTLSLFKDLPEDDINKILEICKIVVFQPKDVIFYEGDDARRFFVILDGRVEVWKNFGQEDQDILAIRGPGDTFGEMALIDALPRSATLRASVKTLCLVQEKEDFQNLILKNPNIALTLMRSVSGMVRQSNETFIDGLKEKNKKLKEAYEEIKKTQEDLIRSERLSTLGKLSSMIIHDIRNPISILKGYGEMIQMSSDAQSKVHEYAQKVVTEASRLSRMAGELLDFSRGDIRLNWSSVNLEKLLDRLKESMEHAFQKNAQQLILECSVAKTVLMDQDRMLRVLINLTDNGRKALGKKGYVKVSIVQEESHADCIAIVVQDNGCGMSEEVLSKVFDPFFSRSSQGGTGLGLLIVSNVVEAHRGKMEIESQEGEGTKIKILLPTTQESI